MRRPSTKAGVVAATKSDLEVLTVFGGPTYQGVGFTSTQFRNLQQIYGFKSVDKAQVEKGQDFYTESLTVPVTSKKKVLEALHEKALDFSEEELDKSVTFLVKVPRGFSGLRLSLSLSTSAFVVRSWEELHKLEAQAVKYMMEGDARNLFRHVESDGLRVMAFLSRFLDPDEDPVQFIARVLAEQGYDILEDV